MTLSSRYAAIRNHTLKLVDPLQKEDFVAQPISDVSPPKWHLAHVTWFFEEFLLSQHLPGYKRYHDQYAYLFNSYYESVGERTLRTDRGNLTRPTVDEVKAYRAYVDEHMEKLLQMDKPELKGLVEIGLQHEQQHQELFLTDIKYILGHNPLFPAYHEEFSETPSDDNESGTVKIPEGLYEIGFEGEGFCFDNERKRHKVFLQEAELSKSLVTNAEYLKFLEAGGYTEPTLWHSDGWAWIQENDIQKPLYWHKIEGNWFRYSMAGLEPLPMEEPVTHISFYEAAAFAEWKGMRLPTEAEWEVAAPKFSWGLRWEFTNSAYLPYPGYEKPPGAIGEYNGKFMINQMVLRGASVATSPGHERITYRNFFHPHLQWQFTGIRLAKKQ